MELRPRKARPPPATSRKSKKPPPSPPSFASEKVSSKTLPFLRQPSDGNLAFEVSHLPACPDGAPEEAPETRSPPAKTKNKKQQQQQQMKTPVVSGRGSLETPRVSCGEEKGGGAAGRLASGMKMKKKDAKKDGMSRILFPDGNEDYSESLEVADTGKACHVVALSTSELPDANNGMDVNLSNLGGKEKDTEAAAEEEGEEEIKNVDHTSDVIKAELNDLNATSDIVGDVTCHIEEMPVDVDGLKTPIGCKQDDDADKSSSAENIKIRYSKSSTKKRDKKKFAESENLGPFVDKFEDQCLGVNAACNDHNTLQYRKKSVKKKDVMSLGHAIDVEKKRADDDGGSIGFDKLKSLVKNDLSGTVTCTKGRKSHSRKETAKKEEEMSSAGHVDNYDAEATQRDDGGAQPMEHRNMSERASSSRQSNDIHKENLIDEDATMRLHGTTLKEATMLPIQKNPEKDVTNEGAEDGGSSSDEDVDVEEMAKYFANSMKEYMQQTDLSVQGSLEREGKREQSLEGEKSLSIKLDSGCSRSNGLGPIWRPETGLSLSMVKKSTDGKSSGHVVAQNIWQGERKLQAGLVVPPIDPSIRKKLASKQKDNTAGAKWFNLSAPTITPELKKELQILKLRGVIDPKRHYKADDSKGLPKYFEVGTIIGGPTDFYSGRLTKKERKSSLADELLADSSVTAYRKRKYSEIQEQKQAGGKAFWKKKQSKRTPAWAKI